MSKENVLAKGKGVGSLEKLTFMMSLVVSLKVYKPWIVGRDTEVDRF